MARLGILGALLTCFKNALLYVLYTLTPPVSPRRPRFDPGSVYAGFVVDKVALGQVFTRVLRFCHVNFIQPVLHYTEKWGKKLIIFITGLHNKPQGCSASIPSAVGALLHTHTHTHTHTHMCVCACTHKTPSHYPALFKAVVLNRGSVAC
jgi:hypothetical protein